MKNFKKFVVLALAVAALVVMFNSRGNQEEGVVASWNGDNYIYEEDKDYSNFYNLYTYYRTVESSEIEFTTSEKNLIRREAVNSTIEMRLLEDEAKRRGYELDVAAIAEETHKDEQSFEDSYPGGFEAFCKHYGLSHDIFLTLNTYEALQELAREKFFTTKKVKEEDALIYYEKNKDEFIKIPHYEVKELFLQVLDKANKKEVINDATVYMNALNIGRSWDFILNTVNKKYNLENGMIFSHYLTGSEIIEKPKMQRYLDLLGKKEAISEKFQEKYGKSYDEMFPEGFKEYIQQNKIEEGSAEYKSLFEAHMEYSSDMYRVERDYAIMTEWREGKCYSSPIYHGGFESYVVLYFASEETEEGEISFEDAKDYIIELLTDERKEKAYGDFISIKMNEINLQIRYEY